MPPTSRRRPAPGAPGVSPRRPTAEDLLAARDGTVPDLIAPGLRVLFCGINPSLYSAAVGHHFARPGNRFWPALHGGGFTDRILHPSEGRELLRIGCGITNVVDRATAAADELSPAELVLGGERLAEKARIHRPAVVALLGITAYRTAFGRGRARVGPQDERIADAEVWVLPNPSGLNAHYRLADLALAHAELREAIGPPPPDRSPPR